MENKRTPEHQRAVVERRRSGASGKHYKTTPRTEIERKVLEEELEDLESHDE